MNDTNDVVTVDLGRWTGLLRLGGWVAIAMVPLIVLQIVMYLIWPPPVTVEGFFELLVASPLYGVITLDVLYLVSNLLAFLLYFPLAVTLWRVSRSGVVVALAFGVLGMAAYMASPRPVEMLTLAHLYINADSAQQVALLAAGEGMLATWMGTAFDVYYFFNLATLLIFAILMLRSDLFTRATAIWGIVAATLMAVPSNFGMVGLVFALASLLPWSVFAVLVARRLFALAGTAGRVSGREETPG